MRVDEVGQAKDELNVAEQLRQIGRLAAIATGWALAAFLGSFFAVCLSVYAATSRGYHEAAEAAPKPRNDQIAATAKSLVDSERLIQKMHRQMDGIEEKVRIIVGQSPPRWSAKVYDANDPEFLRTHPGLGDPPPPRITK